MTDVRGDSSPSDRRPNESWESLTERRIREAMAEGAFESLSGFGQPIPGIDEPPDENWWIKEKLKREEITALPPILQARLEVEKTRERIGQMTSEIAVRSLLEKLRETVKRAHFAHQPGPADGISPIDVEAELTRWREGQT